MTPKTSEAFLVDPMASFDFTVMPRSPRSDQFVLDACHGGVGIVETESKEPGSPYKQRVSELFFCKLFDVQSNK